MPIAANAKPTRRGQLATPATALALGALALALLATCVVLMLLTRNVRTTSDGLVLVTLLAFAAVGVVVARRQPRNAIGWILLAVAVVAVAQEAAKLYLVLDYHVHGGSLPLGREVVFWAGSYTLLAILIGLPVLLLFPDGRAPSTRWRRVLWLYIALAVYFMAAQVAASAQVAGRPVHLRINGEPFIGNPTGIVAVAAGGAWATALVFVVLWGSFVGHQARRWRRAGAEQREQLKWLMSGGAVCVASCVAVVVSSDATSVAGRAVNDAATLGIAALPVSIGIGILKYRLYEIDRLISRTLSYAAVTGVLLGVFAGLVLLTTRVLPFSSPVGVAASTLAAAALFNPLRARVQRLVDRRFNRARYDAEAIVAAFGARLQEAIDLDSVREDLLSAASSVQPAHASIWIRPKRY